MSRFLVGLTGGLASGKSTVAGWLREAGFRVLDADQIVAELYEPGEPGADAVRELFGPEVLTAEGAVDRPRVAERVFADPQARHRLEQAIHPLVRARFRRIAEQARGVLIYEATLLVESGHREVFDLIVSIEAPETRRLEWAVARGMDEAGARARLAAQGDGHQRREGAHQIIRNDGSLADLKRRIDELVVELGQHQARD